MNKFNWGRAIGFGAIIWAILFVFASILVGFGVTLNVWWEIAMVAVAAIAAYVAAANIKAENAGQALGYGTAFAVVGILLDVIISQQFVNGLFTSWSYYLGYAMVLLAPLVEFGSRGEHALNVR